MKPPVAAALGSVPGALAGAVLWTIVATCLLVAYWVGYEALYLGLLCGPGKWSLNWFTRPSAETQDAVLNRMILLTAFAFTFGVAIAAVLGAVFGAAAAAALAKLVAIPKRLARQKRDRGEPTSPA